MNKLFYPLILILFSFNCSLFAQEREFEFEKDTVKFTKKMLPRKYVVDTRIDNMGYWRKMAEAGIVPVAPKVMAPPPLIRSNKIHARGMASTTSTDVEVTSTNSTQSENSIFASPGNSAQVLNSNNSTPQPSTGTVYGADALYSSDTAHTWEGTIQGPTGSNSGDPAAVISNSGRWFIGYINNNSGQSVAYSDDEGTTWTAKVAGAAPSGFGNMLDKNHLWIDNSLTSPYEGNLYDAWTTFGGNSDGEIGVTRSIDNGLSWNSVVHVSSAANAGSHNQGVNIKTGPNGEVYVLWAIYDSWPSDENALAMAKSLDGGATWQPAVRIINNIKGIRNHAVTQNMRVNSFPCMAVDLSDGDNRGNIYVVWTNVNTPGVNSGQGVEVYMIKSTDGGTSWSTPLKINSDPLGTNKQHYLPWITCDPSNGNIAIIFYDNRNVSSSQTEAWCAVSVDGGESFTDFAVSDVASTPTPIPGLADGYMGDYLAISAQDGVVYPCWTDTRSGHAMTYVSPFYLAPVLNQGYVVYYNHYIDDISLGNGNGSPDFGENILLSLSVKNVGDLPDTSVMVTLRTASPYITITDSTELYGNFEVGQIKNIQNGYAFHVADNVPDNTEILFDVIATNHLDSVATSSFTITVRAPQLVINNIRISDPLGNNNQTLDPGETADIVIEYKNTSLFEATSPISQLTTAQSFVQITNPTVNLSGILPGNIDSAVFHVQVANVPFGSAAQLTNTVHYSFQSTSASFLEPIGLIVEDWETAGFNKFPWSFSGNGNWEIDNATMWEGAYSARSATLSNNQKAAVEITYNVLYDDSISFYRKVSSEIFHDVLGFYIDGQKIGQWSGNVNWKRVVFPVTAGPHVFKWEYQKDATGSSGQDKAWIDFIVFPPETKTMVYAGNDMNSCNNNPVQLNGTATNYQTLVWSTSGTGNFSATSILNPIYFPSAADIASGSVTLTLSVTGLSFKESAQSSFVVTFNHEALVYAGNNAATCSQNPVSITDATASFYSGLQWQSTGDGFFNNTGILTPEYTPGANDINTGQAMLFLTASTSNACPSVTDTVLLTVRPLPVVTLQILPQICSGDSVQLHYQVIGTAPFQVQFESGYTRIITDNVWSEWVKPEFGTSYTVNKVTDANGCINTALSTISINVLPSPALSMPADTALCANLQLHLSANAQGAVSYLWLPGNATTPTITVDTAGFGLAERSYSIKATGSNGCVSTASSIIHFYDCSGVEELIGDVWYKIFPNPNKGEFALEFRAEQKEMVKVTITSATGALIYPGTTLEVNTTLTKNFDFRNLAAGVYTIVLENSRKTLTRKIIISK